MLEGSRNFPLYFFLKVQIYSVTNAVKTFEVFSVLVILKSYSGILVLLVKQVLFLRHHFIDMLAYLLQFLCDCQKTWKCYKQMSFMVVIVLVIAGSQR